MSLIHITPSEAASNEMQEIISQLTSYTDAQLRRLHALANTPEANMEVFQLQGDGTVLYVAPVENSTPEVIA
jgi:hypothetical protein